MVLRKFENVRFCRRNKETRGSRAFPLFWPLETCGNIIFVFPKSERRFWFHWETFASAWMYSVLLTKETMLTRFQVARVALINRSNSLTILSIIGVVHFVYSLLGLLVMYSCEYSVFNHVASINANSSRSIKTHSHKSSWPMANHLDLTLSLEAWSL